jgi:hypothetical protein
MQQPGKMAQVLRAANRKFGFVWGPGWHLPMLPDGNVERTLLSAAFDFEFDFVWRRAEVEIKFKGSGQECPLHTYSSNISNS